MVHRSEQRRWKPMQKGPGGNIASPSHWEQNTTSNFQSKTICKWEKCKSKWKISRDANRNSTAPAPFWSWSVHRLYSDRHRLSHFRYAVNPLAWCAPVSHPPSYAPNFSLMLPLFIHFRSSFFFKFQTTSLAAPLHTLSPWFSAIRLPLSPRCRLLFGWFGPRGREGIH